VKGWFMKILTKEERIRIKNAVKQAEAKSSGEFVTVLARKSDSYFYIPLIWSAVIALIVPIILIYIFSFQNITRILDVQFATLLVLYLIFQMEWVTILMTPGHIKKNQARRLAMEQFLIQNVAATKNRSGILFFVSEAERYVEIIADKGINERVKPEEWQGIVDEFIENVRNKRICEGFLAAIERCSSILALHFPPEGNDANELSDKLIEI